MMVSGRYALPEKFNPVSGAIKTQAYFRRSADGNLRPSMPDPTTPSEAKGYGEAMRVADEANQMLKRVEHDSVQLQSYDNGINDFNSQPGVVVTSGPQSNPGNGADKVTESHALSYNSATGETVVRSTESEGTVVRKVGADRDRLTSFEYSHTTNHYQSPLLLEVQDTYQSEHFRNQNFKSRAVLQQVEENEYLYTYQETNGIIGFKRGD